MTDTILHIDTAGKNGLIMVSQQGEPLDFLENGNQMDHASFVQPAIQTLMQKNNLTPQDITCIAVSNGPGSYTGLRVGLASAKGLCFAWNKPLLTLSTLSIMAQAFQWHCQLNNIQLKENDLLVPMLDARRMEVFYGVYDSFNTEPVAGPRAEVVTENFLEAFMKDNNLHFFGDGCQKWQEICQKKHAFFYTLPPLMHAFSKMAYQQFLEKNWADLTYSDPFYLKDFYSPAHK